MNIRELKHRMFENLKNLYPIEEIQIFYFMLLESYGNILKTDVLLNPDLKIDKALETNVLRAIDVLKKGKPIQYILGEAYFFSNRFLVDESVLIPRQETEELVAWIISEIPDNQPIHILDIGCGSGCISISLAKEKPQAKVTAIDISERALAVAQQNAHMNNVEISFKQQDILQTMSLSEKYDVIVSNPPYVRICEKKEIHDNVLKYEPHLALFVSDEKPLIFYEKITELAKNALNIGGKLFFEINQYLGKETSQMIENKGFTSIELRNDLNGNPRMLKALF